MHFTRSNKIVLSLAIIAIFAITAYLPCLLGSLFKHQYQTLLATDASSGQIQARLIQYQRGWLRSEMTTLVTLTMEGQSTSPLPKSTIQWILHQQVVHGPVFWRKNRLSIPSWFGLATVSNQVETTPETKQRLLALGFNLGRFETNQWMVSLKGNYFFTTAFNQLDMPFPFYHTTLTLEGIKANGWFYPASKRLQGKVEIMKSTWYSDQDNTITLSPITLSFDQTEDPLGLFMGKQALSFSELIWYQHGIRSLILSDTQLESQLNESAGFINGRQRLHIQKVVVAGRAFGPIHMASSVNGLNEKGMLDMKAIYQKISRRGELYQNQLRDNLIKQLLLVIHGGTSLQLNALSIETPEGILTGNATLDWPVQGFLVPDDLHELIQSAQAELHATISKTLFNELIQLGASSAYLVEALPDAEQAHLMDLESQLDFTVRQNQILIGELIQSDQLDKEEGLNLIVLQSNLANGDDYLAYIKELVLRSKISLGVSYLLFWQYAQVYQLYHALENAVKTYQVDHAKALQANWNQFVKQGLISEDSQSYRISLSWKNNVFTSNGHPVK